MPETPLLPVFLSDEQREFVDSVIGGYPPIHVLEGIAGTGKSVTLIATVATLAKTLEEPRLLVIAPNRASAEQIAARASGLSDTPVLWLTKALFRERVAAGETIGGEPSIIVLTRQLACQSAVREALASVDWDLIAIEDYLGDRDRETIRVELEERVAVSFCEASPIGAERLVIVRDRLQHMDGLLPSVMGDLSADQLSLMQLGDPFNGYRESVVLEAYSFTRREAETGLLQRVVEVGISAPERSLGAALLWAAMSSFPALNQEVLRERNRMVHGITSRFEPAHWRNPLVREMATPDKPMGDAELLLALIELAEGIDRLEHDSKLEALLRALGSDEVQQPVVLFVHHPATHKFLESVLAETSAPLHVVTPREGDSPADLFAIQAFAEQGGILLASPEQLQGVEMPGASAITFDLPTSLAGMAILRSRMGGRKGEKSRIVALADESGVLPYEQRLLARYGFLS